MSVQLACRGRTSACIETPVRVYGLGLLRREPVALCDACVAVLRAMGTDLRDERRAGAPLAETAGAAA